MTQFKDVANKGPKVLKIGGNCQVKIRLWVTPSCEASGQARIKGCPKHGGAPTKVKFRGCGIRESERH